MNADIAMRAVSEKMNFYDEGQSPAYASAASLYCTVSRDFWQTGGPRFYAKCHILEATTELEKRYYAYRWPLKRRLYWHLHRTSAFRPLA